MISPVKRGPLSFGYVRASTDTQQDSCDKQWSIIQSYHRSKAALGHNELPPLLDRPVEDDAVSGSIPLLNRPFGRDLTGLLQEGDHIIFASMDRAFRKAQDGMFMVDWFQDRGVTMHIVNFGGNSIDPSTPIGKYFITNLVAFAELDRMMIAERLNFGKRRAKALGGWVGGAKAPYGWTPSVCRQAHLKGLMPNLIARQLVTKIFAMKDRQMKPDNIVKKTMLQEEWDYVYKCLGWRKRKIHTILQGRRDYPLKEFKPLTFRCGCEDHFYHEPTATGYRQYQHLIKEKTHL